MLTDSFKIVWIALIAQVNWFLANQLLDAASIAILLECHVKEVLLKDNVQFAAPKLQSDETKIKLSDYEHQHM